MGNSIEENIKKIENLIECFRKAEIVELEDIESIYQKCSYSDYKAINHILSDYKRVLKENEHKTEKIENQKSELAILNDKQKDFNKLQNTLKSYKGQFRRQEKENEELKADNYELNNRINDLLDNIPVEKIKDKIEEYKKLSDKFYVKFLESDRYNTDIREKGIKCDAIILALEELIEEREEK